MTEYYIDGFAGGRRRRIPMDQAEFERAKDAKLRLLGIFGIEEKLALLLENYRELELLLLDLSLKHAVLQLTDWSEFTADIYSVVRRLVNLFSSARLYLDQVRYDLSSLYGRESRPFVAFQEGTKREYDARFGYRVMEALRNHSQHRGLPMSSLTIGWKRREPGEPSAPRVVTADPRLEVESLRQQGDFKQDVLTELEGHGDEVSLMPLVRGYIEGLARAHRDTQEAVEPDLPSLEAVFAEVQDRFRAQASEPGKHLRVVAEVGGSVIEEHAIFDEFIRRGKWLAGRTSQVRYITSAVISSEAPKADEEAGNG